MPANYLRQGGGYVLIGVSYFEPRKKPVDFDGNPNHVTLGLGLRLGGGTAVLRSPKDTC